MSQTILNYFYVTDSGKISLVFHFSCFVQNIDLCVIGLYLIYTSGQRSVFYIGSSRQKNISYKRSRFLIRVL